MTDDSIRQEARAAEEAIRRNSEASKAPPTEAPAKAAAPAPALNIRAVAQTDPASVEAERLKAELQRERVEQGRLKKASDDLAATRAELAETKRKLAEAEAASADKKALGFIAPERRSIVDDDVMKGSADIARGVAAETEERLNVRIAELEARQNQTAQVAGANAARTFDQQIDQAFPGFIAQTGTGGSLETAWGRFLGTEDPATGQPYERSIQEAHSRQRIAGVARVIKAFLDESGVGRRASLLDAVVPSGSASSVGGGAPGRDETVYTTGEVDAALAEARDAYDRGTIDSKAKAAITLKFQTAISEGRVVRGERRRV